MIRTLLIPRAVGLVLFCVSTDFAFSYQDENFQGTWLIPLMLLHFYLITAEIDRWLEPRRKRDGLPEFPDSRSSTL